MVFRPGVRHTSPWVFHGSTRYHELQPVETLIQLDSQVPGTMSYSYRVVLQPECATTSASQCSAHSANGVFSTPGRAGEVGGDLALNQLGNTARDTQSVAVHQVC